MYQGRPTWVPGFGWIAPAFDGNGDFARPQGVGGLDWSPFGPRPGVEGTRPDADPGSSRLVPGRSVDPGFDWYVPVGNIDPEFGWYVPGGNVDPGFAATAPFRPHVDSGSGWQGSAIGVDPGFGGQPPVRGVEPITLESLVDPAFRRWERNVALARQAGLPPPPRPLGLLDLAAERDEAQVNVPAEVAPRKNHDPYEEHSSYDARPMRELNSGHETPAVEDVVRALPFGRRALGLPNEAGLPFDEIVGKLERDYLSAEDAGGAVPGFRRQHLRDSPAQSGLGTAYQSSQWNQAASSLAASGKPSYPDWFHDLMTKGVTEQQLNDIAARTRRLIEYGRRTDKRHAADALQRFVDGVGGTVDYDSDWLRQQEGVQDAEWRNRKLFEHWFVGEDDESDGPQPSEILATMQDGDKPRTIDTFWESPAGDHYTSGTDYLATAGGNTLRTPGVFTFRRVGDKFFVDGEVTHEWKDSYDWNTPADENYTPWRLYVTPIPGFEPVFLGYGFVNHKDMWLLQYHRGAKPFKARSSWRQRVKGYIQVKDGRVVDSSFDWSDIPE
jgi:hypothetical protein